MKAISLFSFIGLACVQYCGNDSDVEPTVAATVVFTGPYETDGCGYQIRLESNSEIYKPNNLSKQYEQDGLKIWLEFKQDTLRYQCGDLPKGRETIRIISLRKRDS